MKKLISIMIFVLIVFSGYSQKFGIGIRVGSSSGPGPGGVTPTYYFANNGNDSNDGLSSSRPKQTLTALNLLTIQPGEIVALKSGDTFTGTINVSNSGTVGKPITYTSYGSGAKPIITGFTAVTEWTDKGGNIWESTNTVSELTTLNMVVVNGVNTPMGRTPNSGYYYFQSHSDNFHITSSDLSGTPDWTGAELAMNSSDWTTSRVPITAQSGGTLTFTQPESFVIRRNDLKFIIQNDLRTLDAQNEWYYNPSTKKISVYSTSEPTDVQVSNVADLVGIANRNYVTFNNIEFKGSNDKAFNLSNVNYITINNCNIVSSGAVGVYGHYTGGNNLSITNCNFDKSNDGAIGLFATFINANITNNTISNSGMVYGANRITYNSTNESGMLYGISALGSGTTISNNTITNTGYCGIKFRGSNVTVSYNYVATFNQIQHDGGGIYTWNSMAGEAYIPYSGTKVYNNIVIGDTVVKESGHNSLLSGDMGIYLDNNSNGIEVYNNTVSVPLGYGLFHNGNVNVNIHHNTVYNCLYGQYISHQYSSNFIEKHNKIIAKNINQITLYNLYNVPDLTSLASDSNYFARPIDGGEHIVTRVTSPYTNTLVSLSEWQTYSGGDAKSKMAAYPVDSSDDIFFVYTGAAAKDTTLSKTYLDVEGTAYSGTVTIPAWSSLVLLDTTTYAAKLSEELLAYWNLDQNSSTLDNQINASYPLVNGGAVVNQTGKIGQSVLFDTNSDELSIAYNTDFMPTGNAFTVSVWVYVNSLPATGYVIAYAPSANNWYVRITSDGKINGIIYNTESTLFQSITASGTITTGSWYNIVLIQGGVGFPPKLYVNGSYATRAYTTAFTGTLKQDGGGSLVVGNQKTTSGEVLFGKVDEVGFWDRALTIGELLFLNNAGNGRTYPFTE